MSLNGLRVATLLLVVGVVPSALQCANGQEPEGTRLPGAQPVIEAHRFPSIQDALDKIESLPADP